MENLLSINGVEYTIDTAVDGIHRIVTSNSVKDFHNLLYSTDRNKFFYGYLTIYPKQDCNIYLRQGEVLVADLPLISSVYFKSCYQIFDEIIVDSLNPFYTIGFKGSVISCPKTIPFVSSSPYLSTFIISIPGYDPSMGNVDIYETTSTSNRNGAYIATVVPQSHNGSFYAVVTDIQTSSLSTGNPIPITAYLNGTQFDFTGDHYLFLDSPVVTHLHNI